jgi:hypothetical protein
VSPDAVTLNTASVVGLFSSATVGSNKMVTVSGLTITIGGANATNYVLIQPTVMADITTAPIIPPTASVSKATSQNEPGNVGMSMTISGTGFKPNTNISVTFQSTPVTVASVSSDAKGSFTATFKVPALASGNHTLQVTDGTIIKDFAFFMDSTAPATVSLLEPILQQPTIFNWSAVADPSGVTYTLQIGQDPTFSALLLEQSGLGANTYKLAGAEKLENSATPYYWRVRASDLAGNAGIWSTTSSFILDSRWPIWITNLWFGLGIMVAFVVGLWIARRVIHVS